MPISVFMKKSHQASWLSTLVGYLRSKGGGLFSRNWRGAQSQRLNVTRPTFPVDLMRKLRLRLTDQSIEALAELEHPTEERSDDTSTSEAQNNNAWPAAWHCPGNLSNSVMDATS